MRSAAQNAELALLLEVCGTPKPGNVDRHRDLEDLLFEHFLAGAVGAQSGLRMAESGESVGPSFEQSVAGMAEQGGGNTQFGALLLLVPLVKAADDGISRSTAESVVADTTVADAKAFYRAFEHVDVFVSEPDPELEALDVRRGSDAAPALEERGLTLLDVMDRSVPGDDVAREWIAGFERSFDVADRIATARGPVADRAATAFLATLAERPDTLVAKRRGGETAAEVTERAADILRTDGRATDRDAVESFADELVSRGINPGTTADLIAAGLFIALENELIEL
ncbi:triphosphoribosyl-dephospho-CoA synthase [Halostagnicola larsenii XH-48]|uniref:Triphosphoribosyl-dephospho-CoA synthase n=1 Tax=Halostagnicola larsenii XH-48 TaxID=797299 RepID=W0JR88_9EURY|nr:triphosphoribosyl-dephospho-CoA synthase [Halostagnicola larsenii]AHF99497.1 triphosphoribosyl-dephospho-CoA synthase [Halostagnicola larsenii XH-48]